MSIEVGLTNKGSEAHRDISSPSEILKVAMPFSGVNWARTAQAAPKKARTTNTRDQVFMKKCPRLKEALCPRGRLRLPAKRLGLETSIRGMRGGCHGFGQKTPRSHDRVPLLSSSRWHRSLPCATGWS